MGVVEGPNFGPAWAVYTYLGRAGNLLALLSGHRVMG